MPMKYVVLIEEIYCYFWNGKPHLFQPEEILDIWEVKKLNKMSVHVTNWNQR